jgi:Zn finger protein HypA/HybF involved in hydrogenase expression
MTAEYIFTLLEVLNFLKFMFKHRKMNLDDTTKAIEFIDSVCTCTSCDHKIASDCVKTSCNCCKEIDHSMVLDGMEGFMTQGK